MATLHQILLWLHIGTGFFGLVLFWVPAIARKGGKLHNRAGRLFVFCAYAVLASAVGSLSLHLYRIYLRPGDLDPQRLVFSALLFYLALITFASVRHGERVIATRRAPQAINTPFHRGLAESMIVAGFALGGVGLKYDAPLLLLFSPLGALGGYNMLRYIRAPRTRHMGWFYEHLGAMLGAGIAFHTAFAVFGARRFVGLPDEGFLSILPWFLPSVIGTVANVLLDRRYRRHFAKAEQAFNERNAAQEAPRPSQAVLG